MPPVWGELARAPSQIGSADAVLPPLGVGWNIAAGYATPRSVVTGWMASTDHCRNILNPAFRDVGTGERDASVGPYGGGTWSQDFGLRLGQSPPSHNQGPMQGCPY